MQGRTNLRATSMISLNLKADLFHLETRKDVLRVGWSHGRYADAEVAEALGYF